MKMLSSKIFAGYLLVIVILTGLILYFAHETTESHYFDTFKRELDNLNSAIYSQTQIYILENRIEELQVYVNNLGDEIKTRITIIDTNGIVLADSQKDPESMENHKNRPEIKKAFQGEKGISTRYSTTVSGDMLYVAAPIFNNNNRIIGISRVSFFLSDINKLNTRLTFEILQIALIVVVISLIGVLIFTRNITSPIKQLSDASRKVSRGDFDTKVFIKGKDEIHELSVNFNYMTERLKELFEQVTKQREEYQTLIASIQEGLIAIDNNGKILISNNSFDSIFQADNLNNKYYYDVIKDEKFNDLIVRVKDKKSSGSCEIEILEKYFLCSANYIESKDEIVILLYNITEIKKLEKIKRDFVVNVSHELKTPLTAIKGFAETLEDEIDEEHLHYLEIIMRHTDRLISIVKDLLTLSELESDNFELLFSNIDVGIIIENVVKMFEPKIKEKGLSLSVDIEQDFPKLRLDVYRIEQVFVNLIENAYKYSDEGFIKIRVFKNDNTAVIEISDSGIGIKKEDQKRIFERFYIADKSRSRKVGGTGLGLSIVKHIILNHGGDIYIDGNYTNGTKFVIEMPINKFLNQS